MRRHTGSALLLTTLFYQHSVALFSIRDTYVGQDFVNRFQWETFDDPTTGRVNYVNYSTATALNLTWYTDSSFVMRADDESIVSPIARGRDSIRITSHTAYSDSVIVLDLEHMPTGCATWPAFWTVSAAGPWPVGGEIDIIEGVNNSTDNLSSLHTTSGCTMNNSRQMTGSTVSTDCVAYDNGNQGCGVAFSKPNNFGEPFNAVNGGWYAMQRCGKTGVSVWFWSRADPTVPADVKFGAVEVQPDLTWGEPEASFPSCTSCNFSSHFDAAQLIFDLTFCGAWAGAVFNSMGCPGSCVDYVNNNASAFSEAYWVVNSLRVYTPYQSPLLFSNTPPD